MGPGVEPPVVAQWATPRAAIASWRTRAIRAAASLATAAGSGRTTSSAPPGSETDMGSFTSWSWDAPDELAGKADGGAGDGIPSHRLQPLGQELELGAPGREEKPVQAFHPIQPGSAADGLGLAGHFHAQLRSPPLGEELQPEGRAGGEGGGEGTDDHGDLPVVGREAGGQPV